MLTDILLANVPVNPKTNIDKNSGYTVVYPEGSVNSAAYPAVQLANALSLTLSTESAGDSAKEIVIIDENLGKELTTPTGKYNVKRDGNKIIITAGDMFGFVGATEFITEKLIKNGKMTFFESMNYNGTYTGDMRETREGTNRVMFHNMWFQDPAKVGMPQNQEHFAKTVNSSIEYELALVAAYQPDVIGFNEYWYGYRQVMSTEDPSKTEFVYRMEKMGYNYLEYTGVTVDGEEGNILFYDPDKVTFTEGSLKYIHYGKMYDAEASMPEGTPGKYAADPYPVGHALAGKWFDTSVKTGRGAIVANFTDNATGKGFTVCCTHFESNGQVDPKVNPQVGPCGNAYRREQGETLLKGLNTYRQTYNAPIILGGDFNSRDTYTIGTYTDHTYGKSITITDEEDERLVGVCDVLRDGGFVNAYTEAIKYDATNAAQACSTHGYPIWNATLERFVNYNSSLTASANSYVESIDHIYVYDTNDVIEECDYWNIIDKPVLCASDHKAILLDFNID